VAKPQPSRDPALLSGAELAEACLAGWHTLNPMLMGLDRAQVAFLLKSELLGRQRRPLLTRLHQRLATLRQQDEWEAVTEAARQLHETPVAQRGELERQVLHRFGALAWLVLELAP
jgi:hypothetical protein